MKKITFIYLSIYVFIVIFNNSTFGQNLVLNSVLVKDLSVSTMVNGTDPCIINNNCTNFYNCRHNTSIILKVDPLTELFNDNPYSSKDNTVTVKMQITRSDINGNILTPEIREFEVSFTNNGAPLRNIHAYTYEGAFTNQIEILEIKKTSLGQPAVFVIPESMTLSIELDVDRFVPFTFPTTFNPIIYEELPASNVIILNLPTNNDPSIEFYEIEYTWVDSELRGSPNEIHYDFYNNATIVKTEEPYYQITNIFPKGYIVARYRYYGRNQIVCDQEFYSDWSLNDEGVISNNNAFYINTGHEPGLNWQRSSSFAENAKRKNVVSYADGSLRNRQSVTSLESERHVLVAESYYDHIGRSSVQAIPTPIINGNGTYEKTIKLYQNVNTVQGQPFDNSHFEFFNSCTPSSISPMDISSGASKYFSSANPIKNEHQAYLSDAEGYPYSQTIFTQDGTNRVRFSGSVGGTNRVGQKDIKYFYGKPSQAELDRLFGNDVGFANYYSKNLAVDNNGQVNISYTDNKGQTIATALAGSTPPEVYIDPLLTNVPKFTVTQNYENQDFVDATNIVDASRILQTKIALSDKTDLKYNYNLAEKIVETDCYIGSETIKCGYDLSISVVDNCDTKLNDNNIINRLSFSSSETETTIPNLPVGEYNVVKKLNLNQNKYSLNEQLFLNNLNTLDPNCYVSIEKFFSDLLTEAYLDGCVNWQCFSTNCLNNDQFLEFKNDIEGYKKALLDCINDTPYTQCYKNSIPQYESALELYNAMKEDFTPGGQYAIYTLSDPTDETTFGTIPANANELSCTSYFKTDNALGFEIEDFESPQNGYSISDFVSNFNNDWLTENIMKYHPDYCYYAYLLQCNDGTYQPSLEEINTFKEAYDNGYLMPIDVTGLGIADIYFDINPNLTPVRDPFYINASGADKINTLNFDFTYNGNTVDYNIYDMAYLSTLQHFYSVPSLLQNGNLPPSGHLDDICPSITCKDCFRDKFWNFFKGFYIANKNKVKYDASRIEDFITDECNAAGKVNITCPSSENSCNNCSEWNEKISNFTSLQPTNVPNQNQGETENNNNQAMHCDETCESNKESWRALIVNCIGEQTANLYDTDLSNLLDNLAAVCKSGCDANHPLGSSTSPTISGPTFSTYLDAFYSNVSFEKTMACNELLINYPPPYSYDLFNGERPLIDDCVCDKYKHIYNELTPGKSLEEFYQKLSSTYTINFEKEDIRQLHCACVALEGTPLLETPTGLDFIPYPFKCDACLDCTQAQDLLFMFIEYYENEYNVVLEASVLINPDFQKYFADWANLRLGFNLSAQEYFDFMAYCNVSFSSGNKLKEDVIPFSLLQEENTSNTSTELSVLTRRSANMTSDVSFLLEVDGVTTPPPYLPGTYVNYKYTLHNSNIVSVTGNLTHTLPEGWKFLAPPTSYYNNGVNMTLSPDQSTVTYTNVTLPPGINLTPLVLQIYISNQIYISKNYYTQASFITSTAETILSDKNNTAPVEPTSIYIQASDPCNTQVEKAEDMVIFLNDLIDANLGMPFEIDPRSYSSFATSSLNLPQWQVYPLITLKATANTSNQSLSFAYENSCNSFPLCLFEIDGINSFNNIKRIVSITPKLPSLGNGGSNFISEIKVVLKDGSIEFYQMSSECMSFIPCDKRKLCNRPLYTSYVEESELSSCLENTLDIIQNIAQEKSEALTKEVLNKFKKDYTEQCIVENVDQFETTYDLNEYHYTLYYFDQAGNLMKTIPPHGIVPLEATEIPAVHQHRIGTPNVPFVNTNHVMPNNYKYNGNNEVIEMKSPDIDGPTKTVYDELGRPILTQDDRQRNDPYDLHTYMIYDVQGRVIESGEVRQFFTTVNNNNFSTYQSFINRINQIPDNDKKNVTVTIYDKTLNSTVDGYFGDKYERPYLRKRVSSVLYYEDYDPTNLSYAHAYHYDYDVHGNVKTLIQENKRLEPIGQSRKRLDYKYDLVSGNVNEVWYQADQLDAFYHRYQYDKDNRLINMSTSRDKLHWDNDASYMYYDHGPLARTELGEYKVQGIDYAYTIQGWIKGINSNQLTPASDIGKDGAAGNYENFGRDAFGYSLNYFNSDLNKDYKPIDGNVSGFLANVPTKLVSEGRDIPYPSLYNGNISGMVTSLADANEGNLAVLPDVYWYDQLHRIKRNMKTSGITSNVWNNDLVNHFKSSYDFDANGNIQHLKRYNGSSSLFDELTYNYEMKTTSNSTIYSTNRLLSVSDIITSTSEYNSDLESGQGGENYHYDKIGNLIKDESEQIHEIIWDHRGKIVSIIRDENTDLKEKPNLFYYYDAIGNRIEKVVVKGSKLNEIVHTYYIRDGQGMVMAVYTGEDQDEDGNIELHLMEHHLYGSSRLGIKQSDIASINLATTTTTDPAITFRFSNQRYYELTNHLGNVTSIVSDHKVLSELSSPLSKYYPVIVSYSDYFPYGMLMEERKSGSGYRYGFNGKENDNDVKGEGNQQDYGFRIYDPRLARFLSVDPLTQSYPMLTPYQYASNTPIQAIDLDGLEAAPACNGSYEGETYPSTRVVYGNKSKQEFKANFFWHQQNWVSESAYEQILYNDISKNVISLTGPPIMQIQSDFSKAKIKFDDIALTPQLLSVYNSAYEKAYNEKLSGLGGRGLEQVNIEFDLLTLEGLFKHGGKLLVNKFTNAAKPELRLVSAAEGMEFLNDGIYKGDLIRLTELNPTHFPNQSKPKMQNLVYNILDNGIQEPINYVIHGGKKYIVNGHHRYFTALQLGYKNILATEVTLPFRGYKTPADLRLTGHMPGSWKWLKFTK
jgi:RHS repeat-associated protein